MSWFYGFWCKYRFAKRIGQELGYRSTNPATLVFIMDRHVKRITGAPFLLNSDCRKRIIVTFVRSKNKGDLSDIEATPDQIKAVGMILYGDGQEHEPRWFTDDSDDSLSEDEMETEDDDPLPLRPVEFYKRLGIHVDTGTSNTDNNQSTMYDGSSTRAKMSPRSDKTSSTDEERPIYFLPAKKTRTDRRKIKITSAGRSRKKHCARV